MTDVRKVWLFIAVVFILLVVVIVLDEPRMPPNTGRNTYTIDGRGQLSSVIDTGKYLLSVDADVNDLLMPLGELSYVVGKKLEFASKRAEILTCIFGEIGGITAFQDNDQYYISDTFDLESYIEQMQETVKASNRMDFIEVYRKDGIELKISHRENLISCYLPHMKKDEKELLKDFASALHAESSFDFDNPIQAEAATIIPVRIDSLPVVATSQRFLLENGEETDILVYQGYASCHYGLSIQSSDGGTLLKWIGTSLPDKLIDRREIIPVEAAIEALIDNRETLYVGGKYPVRHPFYYSEVRLAYGAIYSSDEDYHFRPVYVFVHDADLEWEFCLFVDAYTGEMYDAISLE